MRVVFLDDDSEILSDGLADLDTDTYDVEKCMTIAACKEALTGENGAIIEEDLVVFVDHDLGAGQEGYAVVEWLRRNHPRGHLLPIVYLTGRESERGFIAHQAGNPYHSPSLYLSKRDFARTTFDINGFIEDLIADYERSLAEMEDQRLDETIRFFESLPDNADED